MVSGFEELDGRLLVIFDGQCVLCNGTVRWLLRRDRRDCLRFAASNSEKLAAIFSRHGVEITGPESGTSTVLVVRDFGGAAEEILVRSDAALAILRKLPQPWPEVAATLRLIPHPVRDLGYRLIARWRYRIWGRLESCPLPSTKERNRFL